MRQEIPDLMADMHMWRTKRELPAKGQEEMTRIACTALTGRIMAGRVSKDGLRFTGTPKDVTSDVLKAIIDKLKHHGGSFEITCEGTVVARLILEETP